VTPEPVVIAQLHRRVRDLIVVGDLLARGTPEPGLVRLLKLNPYRAKVLAAQARAWRADEIEAALDGLLDLDAAVKGAEPATPRQVALAFQLWVRDRVAPAGRDPR
jgi:DNA polymerase III delta subunit